MRTERLVPRLVLVLAAGLVLSGCPIPTPTRPVLPHPPPATPTPPPAGTATISGMISDARGGPAVAGATIVVEGR
jgi:uncharacterized lipoprotein YajG